MLKKQEIEPYFINNQKFTIMAKYRFVKRKNPLNKQETPLWYASPVTTQRLATRNICKNVSRNTTLSASELEFAFSTVCDAVPERLAAGNSVQLGRLGWMRLSFGSEGVADIKDFDAATMIKNVKIVFTPSKELIEDIKKGISYENAGVVENGFTFATTRAYQQYKETGELPVEGGTTTPGTGGSDDGNDDGEL